MTATADSAATGRAQLPPLGADEVTGSIPDRFRLVAGLCADAEAVRSPRGCLTYGELDRWSDELADRLLAGSAAAGNADRPVALLLGHEPAAAVAMIAILKAGRPFVPLDAHLPRERIATILELAGAAACVVAGPEAGYGVGGTGGLPDGTDAAPDPGDLLPSWVEPVPVGRRPASGRAAGGPRGSRGPGAARSARGPAAAGSPCGPGGAGSPAGPTGAGGPGGASDVGGAGGVGGAGKRPSGVATRAPRRAGTDPAIVIFTSGSTGVPKGVVWNHD